MVVQLTRTAERHTSSMRRSRSTLAGLLVVGLAASAFALTRPSDRAASACDDACSGCDCFAPEECADREEVCLAGPDCWMPDVCPDRTVVCPPEAPAVAAQ